MIRAAAASLLLAAAPTLLGDGAILKGSVAYRERIFLPADAQIEIRVEEAAKGSEPARVVARIVYFAGGRQVPIPFGLAYDPAKIVAGRSYVLRAAIRSRGFQLFTVSQPAPPLGKGAGGEPVALLLRASVKAPQPATGLTGAVWKLRSLGGTAPLPGRGTSGVEFRLDEKGDPEFSGSAGCNRFVGAWAEGDSGALRILPGPGSKVACAPELAAQEKVFLDALGRTSRYTIEGRVLTLFGADGAGLAMFEATQKQAP